MGILRRSVAQQILQQCVDMGRRQQVDAARHQGDALQVIVDRDREMVAGRRVLAGDHEVAHQPRLAFDPSQRLVEERVRPRLCGRARTVETHAMLDARVEAPPAFLFREMTAGAGIERPVGAHFAA